MRAAARKGLYAWLVELDADIVALQETKAQEHQLPFDAVALNAYFAVYADAHRRGYSGVSIYAKQRPDRTQIGLGWPEIDAEGRFVQIEYGSLSIASLYVPSGTMGLERQRWKDAFLERFEVWLAQAARDGRRHIVCGDFNIAHREIDVYNPGKAVNITGFFPHERAWMERVTGALGWVDAFRHRHPEARGEYSWWSNFQQAFEHNRGWRIDYQLITPDLAPTVVDASIYRDARFSDHAPVIVDYDVELPSTKEKK